MPGRGVEMVDHVESEAAGVDSDDIGVVESVDLLIVFVQFGRYLTLHSEITN